MDIRVYVLTSSKYLWAIRPFAYLFNQFWSELQPVTVVSDVIPEFELPENFKIHSMSGGKPLPKEQWSDGLIVMLNNIPDELFVLLLEDYWLIRKVDNTGVNTLAEYMRNHPRILRFDLTDDRQYAGDKFDIDVWGHYDIIETPNYSPYQISLQAAIWRRDLLLSLLRPGLDPWEVELYLSPTMHEREDMRVVGSRQRPVRYINAFKGGDSEKALNLDGIPNEHLEEMEKRGWLKNE